MRRALQPAVALMLWLLRDARDYGEVLERFGDWAAFFTELLLAPTGLRAFGPLVSSISQVVEGATPEALRDQLDTHLPAAKDALMTIEQQLLQRGEAEVRAEGEAKGKAEALLSVLGVRGVAVSDERRAGVLACADLAQLERWLRAAATAGSAGEVFRG